MNNIYKLGLRTRTRNARTRAKANVIQAFRLVATRRCGRTMQNRCRMCVPSVYFCGITYAYRKRALTSREMFKGIAKSVPNYSQKITFAKL